jgi:hypothetical protein
MIARLYADLGDKEQAFQWLDTAYREHDWLLIALNVSSNSTLCVQVRGLLSWCAKSVCRNNHTPMAI